MHSICVFCGASTGNNPIYREAAQALGQTLAHNDLELVWGGGHIGLMGVLADAVVDAGGHVWGVIPGFMEERELAYPTNVTHPNATEILVVDSMHTRKAAMAARADAFVALPGGFGTLDEFFEILTWAQLSLHNKPIVLLNINGFFEPLMRMVEHLQTEGFIHAKHRQLFAIVNTHEELLTHLKIKPSPRNA